MIFLRNLRLTYDLLPGWNYLQVICVISYYTRCPLPRRISV